MADHYCPHCGASLKKYWHRITPGLVKTLAKVYERVCEKGDNHVAKGELKLSHGEYGNFQKLRFHALIAKYKVNGEWVRGEWLITRRGANFLKGEEQIPHRVQTFRNKVVGHDLKKVSITDVLKSDIYFEEYAHFKNQMEIADILIDREFPDTHDNIPGKRTYTKRGKKMTCSCGGKVVNKLIVVETKANSVVTETRTVCTKCDYDFTNENA